MYQLAASMGLAMVSAGLAAKAKAEEDLANNVAQTERRKLQFNRDQQAYLQNMGAAKRQATSDTFNINLAAAEAEDQLALSRAGSGLTGASINELDDEIARSVGADRVAAQRNLENTQDSLDQQRIGANENRQIEANQKRFLPNVGKDILMAGAGALGAGLPSLNAKSFSSFDTKSQPSATGGGISSSMSTSRYSTRALI